MSLPRWHPLIWLAAIAAAVLALAGATTASATVAALDASAVEGVDLSVVEPPRTEWVLGVTTIAATDVALVVTAVAFVVLALLRHWQGAVVLLLSVLVTQAVVDLAKGLVSRPRPSGQGPVADPSSFSFPSGHSATAVALYLTLALVAVHALRGPARVLAAVAGLALVVVIGASRVYLGVHYPTDVLAGWLTGAGVVLSCWALVSWLRRARPWAPAAG